MVHGGYGELAVLIDGREVIRAGAAAFLGVMPSVKTIVEAVRAALASDQKRH